MKIKKIVTVILSALTITAILANYVNAEATQYSWYCKRNGNKQPEITKEEELISKYNGYSIDRNVADDDEKKILYLTFDAGYENGNIKKILDVLNEKNVSAAFFILDNIILKNPDLVTRMSKEGHLVCNHTKNHINICNMSKEEISKNLSDLEILYEEVAQQKMAKYFRFPEGRYSEKSLAAVNELGYKTIFWSFAYDDWDNARQTNPEKAFNKIKQNTHNGAIILLHPNSRVNAQIMPRLIDEWRNQGYTFGTLDQLCV